jgi:hypothetical protein
MIKELLINLVKEKYVADIILDYKTQLEKFDELHLSIIYDLIYIHKCFKKIIKYMYKYEKDDIFKNKRIEDIMIYYIDNTFVINSYSPRCANKIFSYSFKTNGNLFLYNNSNIFKECYQSCKLCKCIDLSNNIFRISAFWHNSFYIWFQNILFCLNKNKRIQFIKDIHDNYNLIKLYCLFDAKSYLFNNNFKYMNNELQLVDKKLRIYVEETNL